MSRRRGSFGTIHLGHLPSEYSEMAKNGCYETTMSLYYEELQCKDWSMYRAGAFALEVGETRGRVHIQFYVERLNAATWTTYGRDFGCHPSAHNAVIDPTGAWAYCTGGRDDSKEGVLATWSFGTPALYGGSQQKADLRWCVGEMVSGVHPTSILRENPYAYTVHRDRIWKLWLDLQDLEKNGTLRIPSSVKGAEGGQ